MKRFLVARVVVSLVVLGLCAFAAVSLVTFRTTDLPAYSLPPTSPPQNGCGLLGARLADFLLQGLGTCSYVLIVLLGAWAVLNLLGKGLEQLAVRALGAVLLMVCACTFAAAGGQATGAMPGHGGSVGVALNGLVLEYFGHTGQWLLGAALTMMALLMLSVDDLMAAPISWVGEVSRERLLPLLRRRKPRARSARSTPAAGESAAEEASSEPAAAKAEPEPRALVEIEEEAPEPARAPDEPVDTGRPVTVGYLDKIVQVGASAAEADATGTHEGVALDTEAEVPTEAVSEGEPENAAEEAPSARPQAAAPAAPAEDADEPDSADADEGEEADDAPRSARRPERVIQNYLLPPVSLLDEVRSVDRSMRGQHIQQQIEILERTLKEFGVGARVVDIDQGPVVTRYELSLEAGTKLTKVTSLSDDLAIACKAPAVRIVAPIPGKSTVGVELPNVDKELVRMRELLESDAHRKRDYVIPLFLGKDASGKPIVSCLTKMPHLLIAGATNSGKSVCINSIVASILLTQHPDDVRLILIDPKMVELTSFTEIPHLLTPVVTDMKRATWILDWATRKMDERYDILAAVGVRSISAYNRLGEQEIRNRLGEDVDYDRVPFHLPYIIIIVDELADMMMLASKTIETSITRLAQKSRAVGLHIILATQRPSVDVITGLIKSNLPTRISFQVTSKVDSRTILDRNGAEKLLGSGDFLYLPPGSSNLIRAQGTFMSDEELHRIVDFVKRQGKPDFTLNLDGCPAGDDGGSDGGSNPDGYSGDDLYEDACRIVLASGRGSVSLLQRKLEIGYTRAARLVDMMAADGIVGDYKGSKAREVVMTLEEWESKRGKSPSRPAPATADEHYERLDAAAEDDDADD
ncbi:MAG TPA: DNA translocase FtsK [Planctomycetota bacterium]|nr:DNA translocase FtsK [Planctomycetota bacterium]HRR81191.1 DNA translocase FtsK [Planctomycetota bacterium]HRT95225.1 DNA translocase FtsK [Planctomycetota bacterium]